MSRPSEPKSGQSMGYQSYLSRYVLYFLRCPTKGRSKDCIHLCPRYMHSGLCEPCTQFVELECYCEATGIVKPCKEWCDMDEAQKQLIKCCRVRCAKIMECNHQCPRICHPGKCADPKECQENVIRYCNCERIERVFPCRGCGAKDQEVQCDQICAQLLEKYRKAISEMKNNPFKQQQQQPQQDAENTSNKTLETDEDWKETAQSQPETKHESESESGFNEDTSNNNNKTSEDDRTEQEEPLKTSETVVDVDQIMPSLNIQNEENESLGSSKCSSLHRVSRSSSRVSNYSEEDVPRQLDQNKIVKIMRSSTRRKKLIRCDQADVIEETQSTA